MSEASTRAGSQTSNSESFESLLRQLKGISNGSGTSALPTLEVYRKLLEETEALRRDPRPWIEANLQIRTKEREIIPFRFNAPQMDYYAQRTVRDIILKPRQLGFTTQISGLFFADTLLRPNTTSVMLAHNLESTEQIFSIVQLFVERLPDREKARIGGPRYSNRREYFWPHINSRFFVGTAGAVSFGRGITINNLHCSEFAQWPKPEEALLAALEAVPGDGKVVIESTAFGVGNPFHDRWIEAIEERGRFVAQFYVWWENPEYAIPGPPIKELTDEEVQLRTRWGLSDDQIRWRREKLRDLKDKFWQEYPEDWLRCFLASGRCVFDTQKLAMIAQRISREPAAKRIPSIQTTRSGKTQMIPMAPAHLDVWKEPVAGQDYVIGADVGEGLPDGDASCAIVLHRRSGQQVAELHGRVSPARFGHLLNGLGRWYRTAEIGVERNNHGHSTLNTLRNQLGYPQLYYHVAYDSGGGRPRMVQLGWPTTAATKPILVDDLVEAITTDALLVRSNMLVNECYTFVSNATGSAEAQERKFDDRVIAAAIAWQVRKRVRSRASTQRPPGM